MWLRAPSYRGGRIVEPLRERSSAKTAPGQLVYDIVKRGTILAGVSPVKNRRRISTADLIPDEEMLKKRCIE